jgi:hypothetical protein
MDAVQIRGRWGACHENFTKLRCHYMKLKNCGIDYELV